MKRVIGGYAAAGCAALLIGGCGTTHASSGDPAPSSGPAKTASAAPRDRAASDAASILSSFVPPAGASRLASAPAADNGALRRPAVTIGSSDVVDQVSWWSVPGTPGTALAWVKSHLSSRFTPSGSGTVGAPAAMWSDQYSLPPVAGVLTQRELTVAAVSAGGGRTAMRVDGQVAWVPARPASDRVPATATVVTISAVSRPAAGAKVPTPVTIANPALVRRIASLVNSLPLVPPGRYSCPAELGKAVQMAFRARPGGPLLAVATAPVTGCQGLRLIVSGTPQPALAGGTDVARRLLTLGGLHWTGYNGGPAMPPVDVNPGGVMRPGG